MGGNAFNTLLPNATFPRMPASLYFSVKARLIAILDQFYSKVSVPREAPEKVDFGDLDFVVFGARKGLIHEELVHAMGAARSIPCEGSRGMHQFAIPVSSLSSDEWASSAGEAAFFQIDVMVCGDEEELDRVVTYTSYGDLGIIMSSVARGLGLSVGRAGLKLADPLPTTPAITFRLSTSFPDILAFFRLSIEKWTEGFATQQEIFDWIASSPFFDPRRAPQLDVPNAKTRKWDARPMFQKYLLFCRTRASQTNQEPITPTSALQQALEYFGRRELYDLLLRISAIKKHAKATFQGKQVTEWTGLQGMPVKLLMDEVKSKLGGTELVAVDVTVDDEIDPLHLTLTQWENQMFGMSLAEVRQLTVETKGVMDKEGRLVFDWKAAKQRKAAEKAAREVEAKST